MNSTRQEEKSMFEILDSSNQEAVIKVIGVGGCGGNAVDHMVLSGVHGVEFICANTDAQALKRCQSKNQLHLGSALTKGLGAGANPEIGRQAALEDRERIAEAIRGADMLFLTAGMGGGTGTGAAPVVAEIAKEMGILTIAVVTKPFTFERKRVRIAQEGIEALSQFVDSLIVIPNDKLMEVLGADVTMQDAFKAANEVLHGAVAGIAEIITLPGMINVDFADVRTVMSETGIAMMGSGSASGVDRAKIAAEQAVACPLLENIDLNNARGVLVNVSGAASKLKLGEIHEVMETVSEFLADDATTIVGSVFDEEMGDSIRVTIVATGLGNAVNRAQPKAFTVVKTGTDNSPVELIAQGAGAAAGARYGELDEPAVFRRKTRDAVATVEALKQSGLEMYDIPAFLRKQAD
jgi:cell division protein FtsZ